MVFKYSHLNNIHVFLILFRVTCGRHIINHSPFFHYILYTNHSSLLWLFLLNPSILIFIALLVTCISSFLTWRPICLDDKWFPFNICVTGTNFKLPLLHPISHKVEYEIRRNTLSLSPNHSHLYTTKQAHGPNMVTRSNDPLPGDSPCSFGGHRESKGVFLVYFYSLPIVKESRCTFLCVRKKVLLLSRTFELGPNYFRSHSIFWQWVLLIPQSMVRANREKKKKKRRHPILLLIKVE